MINKSQILFYLFILINHYSSNSFKFSNNSLVVPPHDKYVTRKNFINYCNFTTVITRDFLARTMDTQPALEN